MRPDYRTNAHLPLDPVRRIGLHASLLLTTAQALRGRGLDSRQAGAPGWYDGFAPLAPGLKGVGGRLLAREDACVQGSGEYRQEATLATSEKLLLERAMHVTPRPHTSRPPGSNVDGTVLVLTVHHMHSFSVYNIAHLAVSAFPVFDALMALEESQGSQPVDISAVLFWQIERSSNFLKTFDWFTKVPQLIGNRGLNTSMLFAEDLQGGICAKRLLLYHRPIVDGKVETHFFTSPAHARAFRELAVRALGPPGVSLARARGQTALLAVRRPPQGYSNVEEITQRMQEFFAKHCWQLKVWMVGEGDMSLGNQVGLFANAVLSISTHGAHLSNVVWQPPGSAAFIIHKCHEARRLFQREAIEAGLRVFKSFPSDCRNSGMRNSQDILDYGEYKANFEKDVLPVLERALAELGRPGCSGAATVVQKK